jgi:hypothetical protein
MKVSPYLVAMLLSVLIYGLCYLAIQNAVRGR